MAKQLLNEFADISALKKQQAQVVGVLDDVTKKLKEMQAMGLSFSKGSASTSGMKDAAKTIDEQAKAVARLEAEQKKLAAAQNELYKSEQQMVQVRKEAERQAKLEAQATNEQIGAYKRLEAEAALATQKFRDLAAQYGIESNEAKNAGIQAAALNQKLKDVDATVNLHQKNVGNYKEATVSLRTEIRTLTQTLAQMAMSGKENTKEYNDMVAKLGNLRDTMGDVAGRAKFFADDARWITAAASAVQGLVGAYAAYQGVVNLVGEENKELQKSMMKIQSLMAIIMGMQQVAKALNKDEAAMTAFRVIKQQALALQLGITARAEAAKTAATVTGTVATKAAMISWKALDLVMKTSVIFAMAAVIIGIVVAVKKFKDAQFENAEATRKFNEAMSDSSEEMVKWRDKIADALGRLTDAQLAYAVAAGKMTQAQADQIKIGKEFEVKHKELADQFVADSQIKIRQQEEETKRIIEQYDEARAILVANGMDTEGLEKERQAKLLEIRMQGQNAVQALLKQHLKALSIEQQIAYEKEKANELKKQQDRVSAYEALTAKIEALTKKMREEITITGKVNEADKIRLTGLIEQKDKIDELVKSMSTYGEAVKLTLLDVFPDDFDAKWEAWQKKLEDTPAKVDEVVDGINETGFALSFVDKAMSEMAEKNTFEEWIKLNIDNLDKWADRATKVAESISSIMSDTYKKQSEEAEAAHTKEMDSLKKMLNQGIIDQASYDAQSAALEEKYIAEKKERDRKEFERKKAIAIAEGTVNMALALIKVWASDGTLIEKIAMSLVAAADLAAQISSMRVASYATGRDDGPAELAFVGERGFEYVETSSGKLYKTPNTATLTYLNAGDKVYTHTQSVDLEKTIGVNSLSTLSLGKSDENSLLYGKMDEMIRVYKNKKEVHMNLSRSGVMMAIKDGNRWSRHLNDNVRL